MFEFPKPQHTTLPSLIEAMTRRTPNNTIVKELLRSAVCHKLQLEENKANKDVPAEMLKMFPLADDHLLSDLAVIFACTSSEAELVKKWKCLCQEEEDTRGVIETCNECVICGLKTFLVEGGLNYIVAWWMRELEDPRTPSGRCCCPSVYSRKQRAVLGEVAFMIVSIR